MDVQSYIRLGDLVEDRSLYNGFGHIVYLRGNEACVRFSDGSEEVVDAELFTQHDARHWII